MILNHHGHLERIFFEVNDVVGLAKREIMLSFPRVMGHFHLFVFIVFYVFGYCLWCFVEQLKMKYIVLNFRTMNKQINIKLFK